MTDVEIRQQLAVQIAGRQITIEPTGSCPKLIVTSKSLLMPDAILCIRDTFMDFLNSPRSEVVVIDGGLDVFQLVGGEWKKLS